MANTFHDRLTEAYEAEQARRLTAGEPRLSMTDIWRAAGKSSGAATHWFNGANEMSLETCFKVAPVLRCDARWLFDGSIPKTVNLSPSSYINRPATVSHLSKARKDGDITINRFDTGGSMGTGVMLRDQPGVIQSWNVSQEWLNKNIKSHTGAKNLCVVTGFGDSMKGMYNPGDPLIIDTGINDVAFDAVYFFRIGTEGFIKRLQRIPGEGIRAISENKAYESWTIRPDMDFEVFGRVLKVWQSEEF